MRAGERWRARLCLLLRTWAEGPRSPPARAVRAGRPVTGILSDARMRESLGADQVWSAPQRCESGRPSGVHAHQDSRSIVTVLSKCMRSCNGVRGGGTKEVVMIDKKLF